MTTTPTTPSQAQWMLLIAYAINTFVTFYGMTGAWTDGCTNSTQSAKYFTLITPPGWAFGIWGIIFIWEALGCLVAFVPQWTAAYSGFIVDNTFVTFWSLACVLQAAWSLAFCLAIEQSWFVLFAVWLCLLGLQQSSLSKLANLPATTSTGMKVSLYLILIAPFSLHLGWATAATALNINSSAVSYLISPDALTTVALCTIIFVTAMAWTFAVTGLPWTKNHCDPAMAVGVLWALFAVIHRDVTKTIKSSSGNWLFSTDVTTPITNTTMFVFWFLVAVLVLRLKVEGVIAIIKRRFFTPRPAADCEAAPLVCKA